MDNATTHKKSNTQTSHFSKYQEWSICGLWGCTLPHTFHTQLARAPWKWIGCLKRFRNVRLQRLHSLETKEFSPVFTSQKSMNKAVRFAWIYSNLKLVVKISMGKWLMMRTVLDSTRWWSRNVRQDTWPIAMANGSEIAFSLDTMLENASLECWSESENIMAFNTGKKTRRKPTRNATLFDSTQQVINSLKANWHQNDKM